MASHYANERIMSTNYGFDSPIANKHSDWKHEFRRRRSFPALPAFPNVRRSPRSSHSSASSNTETNRSFPPTPPYDHDDNDNDSTPRMEHRDAFSSNSKNLMDDVLTDENEGRKSSLEIVMLKSPLTPSKTEEFESETNEDAARRLSEQSNGEEELRLVNVDKPKLVPTVQRATSLPQLNESVPPSMFQLINGTDKTCTFLVIGVTFGQLYSIMRAMCRQKPMPKFETIKDEVPENCNQYIDAIDLSQQALQALEITPNLEHQVEEELISQPSPKSKNLPSSPRPPMHSESTHSLSGMKKVDTDSTPPPLSPAFTSKSMQTSLPETIKEIDVNNELKDEGLKCSKSVGIGTEELLWTGNSNTIQTQTSLQLEMEGQGKTDDPDDKNGENVMISSVKHSSTDHQNCSDKGEKESCCTKQHNKQQTATRCTSQTAKRRESQTIFCNFDFTQHSLVDIGKFAPPPVLLDELGFNRKNIAEKSAKSGCSSSLSPRKNLTSVMGRNSSISNSKQWESREEKEAQNSSKNVTKARIRSCLKADDTDKSNAKSNSFTHVAKKEEAANVSRQNTNITFEVGTSIPTPPDISTLILPMAMMPQRPTLKKTAFASLIKSQFPSAFHSKQTRPLGTEISGAENQQRSLIRDVDVVANKNPDRSMIVGVAKKRKKIGVRSIGKRRQLGTVNKPDRTLSEYITKDLLNKKERNLNIQTMKEGKNVRGSRMKSEENADILAITVEGKSSKPQPNFINQKQKTKKVEKLKTRHRFNVNTESGIASRKLTIGRITPKSHNNCVDPCQQRKKSEKYSEALKQQNALLVHQQRRCGEERKMPAKKPPFRVGLAPSPYWSTTYPSTATIQSSLHTSTCPPPRMIHNHNNSYKIFQ